MQATCFIIISIRQDRVTGQKIRMEEIVKLWGWKELIASAERINSREGNKERWDYRKRQQCRKEPHTVTARTLTHEV